MSASEHDGPTVILDNYDSYAYNLYQRLGELVSGRPRVFRNDEVSVEEIDAMDPRRIVLSPGPGRPELPGYFGVCSEVLAKISHRVPTLGVCLGHQGIAHFFGGKIVSAPALMHGKTSPIFHDGLGIFAGLAPGFSAMRYHSLIVERESLPACLEVSAEADDGVVMAVRHRSLPIVGLQFHPESIGTPAGYQLLQNFVALENSLNRRELAG